MNIIDRINLHLKVAQAASADVLLIGKREAAAFRSQFAAIYRYDLDYDSLRAGTFIYRGLRIYVADTATMFVLLTSVYVDEDPNVQRINPDA